MGGTTVDAMSGTQEHTRVGATDSVALGYLPTFLLIGAMKAGTTALHGLLAQHPDIAMSEPKELNFFLGPAKVGSAHGWHQGNWHRGLDWYRSHWRTPAPARGESSPGYTSPSHPQAADRIRRTLPGARLVLVVRDPVDRAVSQYRHHVRDGAETRPLAEAVLDPGSQYLARSRYSESVDRFADFLAASRLLVVDQHELRHRTAATVAQVQAFLGVTPRPPTEASRDRDDEPQPSADPGVVAELRAALAPDAARLRALTGMALPHWSL